MTKAEHTGAGGAVKVSGCGCSSNAAARSAETTKTGCCGGGHDQSAHGHHDHPADRKADVRDPVCGMSVDPATSKHRFDYRGKTYHFCSAGCRTKFAADPKAYLDKRNPNAAAPEGTIYTCPMHPQIRQVGPGSCPICGMALEPEVASLDDAAESRTRRHDAALLGGPCARAAGGRSRDGRSPCRRSRLGRPDVSNWIQLVFATPVVLWAGWPFFVRGWQSLRTRNLNMFTLIAMGTGVAYLYSLVGTVAPQFFPATFRGHGGAVAVYFEAAAVITVLVLLGQVLELRAREATSGAIKALLELAPKTARRLGDDGADHEVQIDSLQVGDRLRVRPGEKVPVDGVILEGRSSLDESLVTGESMPVTKEAGGKVIAGTLNQSGGFVMRAEKVGRDTLLSQIVKMVAEAQRSRAPIQRLGRSGRRLVRAGRDRRRGHRFWRLGLVRTGTPDGLRAGRRRQRADYRLSLRARTRHADVDHGRRRARRAGRRTDQERRSAGAHGKGRHAGGRQDRHTDRRQAEGGRHRCRGGLSRRTKFCGSQPVSNAPASIRSPMRSFGPPSERNLDPGQGRRVRLADRQGRDRQGRRAKPYFWAIRTSWHLSASKPSR